MVLYVQAEAVYKQFVDTLSGSYQPGKIQQGVFGAMMEVSLNNDGPVTFIYDPDNPSL